jgi:hypothetical protein
MFVNWNYVYWAKVTQQLTLFHPYSQLVANRCCRLTCSLLETLFVTKTFFFFGKFVREPICSWSEAFVNQGSTVHTSNDIETALAVCLVGLLLYCATFLHILRCVLWLLMLAVIHITMQCSYKDLVTVLHFLPQAVAWYCRNQVFAVVFSQWCSWWFYSSGSWCWGNGQILVF